MSEDKTRLSAIERAQLREREAIENRRLMPLVAEMVAQARADWGKGISLVCAFEGDRSISPHAWQEGIVLKPLSDMRLDIERRRGKFYLKNEKGNTR